MVLKGVQEEGVRVVGNTAKTLEEAPEWLYTDWIVEYLRTLEAFNGKVSFFAGDDPSGQKQDVVDHMLVYPLAVAGVPQSVGENEMTIALDFYHYEPMDAESDEEGERRVYTRGMMRVLFNIGLYLNLGTKQPHKVKQRTHRDPPLVKMSPKLISRAEVTGDDPNLLMREDWYIGRAVYAIKYHEAQLPALLVGGQR